MEVSGKDLHRENCSLLTSFWGQHQCLVTPEHFCGAFYCVIILLSVLNFIIILLDLVCMTWVTAAWEGMLQRVGEMLGKCKS